MAGGYSLRTSLKIMFIYKMRYKRNFDIKIFRSHKYLVITKSTKTYNFQMTQTIDIWFFISEDI
ncbi:hypothetical protein Hanom_Chr12g01102491 [Helianthus anomalus]